MTTHTFTLIPAGIAEITPELADALYAATQGDIEFNLRDGVAFVEVERTAATLREAIITAISEIEQAAVGVARRARGIGSRQCHCQDQCRSAGSGEWLMDWKEPWSLQLQRLAKDDHDAPFLRNGAGPGTRWAGPPLSRARPPRWRPIATRITSQTLPKTSGAHSSR